jgi:hypothetical protein
VNSTERITASHIEHLNSDGFVLVPKFLSNDELAACQADVSRYFPSHLEFLKAPRRYSQLQRTAHFPFIGNALNFTAVHLEIVSFLQRLYGFKDIRLGQSLVQVKYGRRSGLSTDQVLHCDAFGKHCLVYPRDDGMFRQIRMILYYSDVSDDLGPTYIVSQRHTRDPSILTESRSHFRRREEFPDLYEQEHPVLAEAGSLLIFSGRTFHRGTAIKADVGERYAQFNSYHAAAVTWMENQSWPGNPPNINAPEMERFMVSANPSQREMLGFPAPGHSYWNDATLLGVSVRYPKMDMSPYVNKISSAEFSDR